MTTEISPQQNAAADFLADYFQSVVVSSPNKHGNVMLTALFDDREQMKWILRPDGQIIYTSDVRDGGPTHEATSEYLRRFREGSL